MHARTVLVVAAAALITTTAANASPFSAPGARSQAIVATVAQKQTRPRRDCTPTNGPYGFYGNIWCQPPNEMSYMRNLSASWPQKTPPALKNSKPDNSNDW